MKNEINRALMAKKKIFSLFAALTLSVGLWATNATVSNLDGLQEALSTVDTVFVSQTINLTTGTTVDGKGKVISVPQPYMAETGMIAATSSNYSVFNVSGAVTIMNATVLGGNGEAWSSAGGINVNSGASLTMENVTVARSYRGVYIAGTVIMKNCDIVRNVCEFGGGMLVEDWCTLIMDGCSLSENRSLNPSGGGGAMEIRSEAKLYANNTVIANNSSTEIGGAINLYSGTMYLTNCTISGNTNQTDDACYGAGIGNNCGTMYAVNCIFMNNTFFDYTDAPTPSDIGFYYGSGSASLINCIYGAAVSGTPTAVNCKVATDSDPVFAGYRQDGVFRGTNAKTPGYKHSILTRKEGGSFFSIYAPAGTFSSEGGVATYVDLSDVNNIKMAYDNGGVITSLGGLSIEGLTDADKVTTYYESDTRAAGVVGASAVDPRTYYTVKLILNEHVSVTGVTIYGESYPEGAIVPISHTTEDGFYFHGWNLYMGETPKYVNANPYNLEVHSDVDVYPQVAVNGAYSIFVDLPNKDYVFDVTSGSAKPINEGGYPKNTQVTLQGARSGYIVEKWIDFEGNELSTDNIVTITMDGDKNINPIWAPDPNIVTVTVLPAEHCSVSGLVEGGQYPKGTLVTLTAEPEIGYQHSQWKDADGNVISTDNPLVIIATQNITVRPVVVVEQRSYEIATGVTAQMGTLDKPYPWTRTIVKPGLAYWSTTGHHGKDSRDELTITPEDGVAYRLTFDWAVSSESGWDWLTISINGEQKIRDSGNKSGSYNSGETLLTEPTTIVMSYAKDGSGNYGDDRGYIYNIVVTSNAPQVYTRDVTDGSWGTICLPWESTKLEGGDFYDVLGTKHAEYGVALVELGESDQLTAGKPYVFKATSSQIKVTYNPTTEVANPVAGNHIIGSFAGCTVPNGMYIIYNNLLYITDGSSTIGTNRAYFDVASMGAYNPATAPARVVFMGGRQAPTDNNTIHHPQSTIHKVLKDGQFIIIKDNKMYNAQGIEIQ